jgi:hypothetical protein
MIGAVTAERIAAENLIHGVVHHDAGRRRECIRIPQRQLTLS